MTFNPLLPFFPDSISFLIYGLITGLLLKFWRIAKKSIFVALFFLYAYAVWIISMYLLMFGQTQTRQAWFIFGFALTFFKIFSIIRTVVFTPFTFAFETIREGMQERRADQRDRERQEQRERDEHAYREQNQDLFREEQARREAEARANRAKQTGNEQAKTRTDNERIEDSRKKQQSKPPAPPPTTERRSYEEILGLSDGWTDEDLKTAYKREAQRTHPDKWIGKPQTMRDMMEAEYKAVQEAYRKLKN